MSSGLLHLPDLSAFLSASIVGCEVREETGNLKQFTIYCIQMQVTLPSYYDAWPEWVCYRRYSQFSDLHAQLVRSGANTGGRLPLLPPKRLTGVLEKEFVEQRRGDLEAYLTQLIARAPLAAFSPFLCAFLEIPKPLQQILWELLNASPSGLATAQQKSEASGATDGTTTNPLAGLLGEVRSDEDAATGRVRLLLSQFEELANNKVTAIREFESWFVRTKPNYKEDTIALLLIGNANNGLLLECGAMEHSIVSCSAALGLLRKLTSHEYNPYTPAYISVMVRMAQHSPNLLKHLRLHVHIRTSHSNNRRDAFHLLSVLTPQISRKQLHEMMPDEYALHEFWKWLEVKSRLQNTRFVVAGSVGNFTSAAAAGAAAAAGGAPGANHTGGGLSPPNGRSSPSPPQRISLHSKREYEKLAENAFTSLQTCLATFQVEPLTNGDTSPVNQHMTQQPSVHHMPSYPSIVPPSTPNNIDSSPSAGTPTPTPPIPPLPNRVQSGPPASTSPMDQSDVDSLELSEIKDDGMSPLARVNSATSLLGLPAASSWQQVDIPPSLEHLKVSAVYQKLTQDKYILRAHLTLPFPAWLVAAALADLDTMLEAALQQKRNTATPEMLRQFERGRASYWNTKVREVSVLEKVNDHTDVLSACIESSTTRHAHVRMCLLRAVKYLPNDMSFMLVYTSVKHQKYAQSNPSHATRIVNGGSERHKHVEIKPSGVLILPLDDTACQLNISAMLSSESIVLFSAELLGESNHLWTSLANLHKLLSFLHPLPADMATQIVSYLTHTHTHSHSYTPMAAMQQQRGGYNYSYSRGYSSPFPAAVPDPHAPPAQPHAHQQHPLRSSGSQPLSHGEHDSPSVSSLPSSHSHFGESPAADTTTTTRGGGDPDSQNDQNDDEAPPPPPSGLLRGLGAGFIAEGHSRAVAGVGGIRE
ncbi:unnamed protein product [Vitrella brassicaformis CCMP3155]|uniref:PX domain-containing protein n=3 Tax=Vitrella brassicaformis TaxID=1169539 RepID=A0A0G4EAF7_VITBC|nr:unnamed protein product [Vitrella brassicaformis CCMP3155]|eukprot:CEL92941.1 unnamed protein product [Vitrella brassicaformis CCMP3155]